MIWVCDPTEGCKLFNYLRFYELTLFSGRQWLTFWDRNSRNLSPHRSHAHPETFFASIFPTHYHHNCAFFSVYPVRKGKIVCRFRHLHYHKHPVSHDFTRFTHNPHTAYYNFRKSALTGNDFSSHRIIIESTPTAMFEVHLAYVGRRGR